MHYYRFCFGHSKKKYFSWQRTPPAIVTVFLFFLEKKTREKNRVFAYIFTHIYTRAYTYIHIYVCAFICVYIYVYTYIFSRKQLCLFLLKEKLNTKENMLDYGKGGAYFLFSSSCDLTKEWEKTT